MRFTQTVIEYKSNLTIHSPEYSLVNGKGDCSDYSMLFAFLLSYYFSDLDVVFLNYYSLEHVRLGIYNPNLNTTNKSFV